MWRRHGRYDGGRRHDAGLRISGHEFRARMLRIRRRHDAAELRTCNSGYSSEHNDDVTRLHDHVTHADVTYVDGTTRQHCTVLIHESMVFESRVHSTIQQSCIQPLNDDSPWLCNGHGRTDAGPQLPKQRCDDASTAFNCLAGCSVATATNANGPHAACAADEDRSDAAT